MMSTLEMLEELYKKKVDFDATEFSSYKSKAEHVVNTLLKEVQEHLRTGDPKISLKPIGTGSAFEGVKVKPDLEFDFMVPIEITSDQIIFSDEDPDIPVCFGIIQIEGSNRLLLNQSKSTWVKDQDFKNKFCVLNNGYGHVLSAKMIQQWFQSMCARTLPALRKYYRDDRFTFRESGPARTLVFQDREKEVKIDIVPAVPYKGVYLVAKMTSHLGEAAWRLSFSTHEKAFFDSLPHNSCYFKCLKILKYLRENDKKTCPSSQLTSSCPSYFLKTAFFHYVLQIDKNVWQNYNLKTQVKGLILYLDKCIKQQHLPHIFLGNKELVGRRDSWLQDVPSEFFYYKEINLLKEFNSATLDQISRRLIYIHDKFEDVLQQSHAHSTHISPGFLPQSSTEHSGLTGQVGAEERSYGTVYSGHHSPPTFQENNFMSQSNLNECQMLCEAVIFLIFMFVCILLQQQM